MLLRGELQIDAINSNFENFESTLYMKSVSMPLKFCYFSYKKNNSKQTNIFFAWFKLQTPAHPFFQRNFQFYYIVQVQNL